jgi:hypothetical protein
MASDDYNTVLRDIEQKAKYLGTIPVPPAKVWVRDMHVETILGHVEYLRGRAKNNAKAARKD